MSLISEKVRPALYVKTNVSALVDTSNTAKLYGIYEGKVQQKVPVDRAYGVFNRQAMSPVLYTLSGAIADETDFWQLRVYAVAAITAETLLNLWVSTLGESLTLSGNTVTWCRRENDLPPTDRQLSDRYVFGRGALIRISAE